MLLVGFFTLLGLARAGSILFWHVRLDLPVSVSSGSSPKLVWATCSLLAASVLLSAAAAPIQRYTQAAAEQLSDRAAYAAAVLGAFGEPGSQPTTRPYVDSKLDLKLDPAQASPLREVKP